MSHNPLENNNMYNLNIERAILALPMFDGSEFEELSLRLNSSDGGVGNSFIKYYFLREVKNFQE